MKRESTTPVVEIPPSGPPDLDDLVAMYLSGLVDQGYKAKTIANYRRDLHRYVGDLRARGYGLDDMASETEPFIERIGSRGHGPQGWRSVLGRFVAWLRDQGHLPVPRHCDDAHHEWVEQYVQFQVEHRGVCAEYAKELRRVCGGFLQSIRGHSAQPPHCIPPHLIQSFVNALGQRYSRVTMSSRCYILRGFLRFLYRQGTVPRDLAPLVRPPIRFKHEECPRFIEADDLRRILAIVDRSAPLGRRDYAMIMLLAVYGLRGIEVIRLRLEDLDWDNGVIHIRSRKAGNTTAYPLASSVAEAIVEYLRKDRPNSPDRHVFLSTKAPFRSLVYTYALGYRLRKYMKQAGVVVARPGTHTLRYSCAQRLLAAEKPLKWIADYLGHSELDSTRRYLKIDIERLREVAVNDGEELL